MAGPDVLCVGSSSAAQIVLKRIEREASHRYQTLTLPEEGPSGCLFINGTLLHRTKEETPKCEAVSIVRIILKWTKLASDLHFYEVVHKYLVLHT